LLCVSGAGERSESGSMMALVSTAALLAFTPMAPLQEAASRRTVVGTFAAAVAAAPFAALADGASSPTVRERARVIYGSRVARLSSATADQILEEKNAFTLFTTGAYRSDAATKQTKAELTALSKKALASAKAGDTAGAQAAVKEFVKVGEIRILDTNPDAIFNPKQRRNPGAPPTSEIMAQMGTQGYALYQPLK